MGWLLVFLCLGLRYDCSETMITALARLAVPLTIARHFRTD